MQLALIGGIVAGIWLAVHGSASASEWLAQQGVKGPWLVQLGFVLIFVAVYLLAYLGGKSLSGVFQVMMLGWVNKLAGGIFGLLKMLLLVSAALYFVQSRMGQMPAPVAESAVYASFQGIGEEMYRLLR